MFASVHAVPGPPEEDPLDDEEPLVPPLLPPDDEEPLVPPLLPPDDEEPLLVPPSGLGPPPEPPQATREPIVAATAPIRNRMRFKTTSL